MGNKLKTRKTATKRFKVTSSGKLIRGNTGLNHLMRKKSMRRRRDLLNGTVLYAGDRKRIAAMMGEGH